MVYIIYRQMMLKKREQFRCEIRRKQLDRYMQDKRKKLLNATITNQQNLQKILNSINKIELSSIKQSSQAFRQLNIPTQLSEIIMKTKEVANEEVAVIIDILHMYLRYEVELGWNQNKCEIGGIDILGVQNSQQQIFVDFCLKSISKNIKQCIFSSLSALILIFGKHPHLISRMSNKQIKQIVNLIKSSSLNIQKKAIQLICDMITQQIDISDDLLSKNWLVDILYIFLNDYSKMIDEDAKEYSYIIGCIICNLTLSTHKQGVQLLLQHPIWKFVLQSCTDSNSPFFPIITIFEYLFAASKSKTALQILDHYLFKISILQLRILKERQAIAIKQAIRNTYYNYMQKWEQNEKEIVKRMIQHYKLDYLLEDLQDLQEKEDLNYV